MLLLFICFTAFNQFNWPSWFGFRYAILVFITCLSYPLNAIFFYLFLSCLNDRAWVVFIFFFFMGIFILCKLWILISVSITMKTLGDQKKKKFLVLLLSSCSVPGFLNFCPEQLNEQITEGKIGTMYWTYFLVLFSSVILISHSWVS